VHRGKYNRGDREHHGNRFFAFTLAEPYGQGRENDIRRQRPRQTPRSALR
jgi:hypothetical protein